MEATLREALWRHSPERHSSETREHPEQMDSQGESLFARPLADQLGDVAQLVERGVRNAEVGSSILPVSIHTFGKLLGKLLCAPLV